MTGRGCGTDRHTGTLSSCLQSISTPGSHFEPEATAATAGAPDGPSAAAFGGRRRGSGQAGTRRSGARAVPAAGSTRPPDFAPVDTQVAREQAR